MAFTRSVQKLQEHAMQWIGVPKQLEEECSSAVLRTFRPGEAGEVQLQRQDVPFSGRLDDLRELVVRLPRLLQRGLGQAAGGG